MARIPALEPPFAPDVEAQLATMMPAGMPPIGLFRTFAKNLPMTVAMSNWGRDELGRDLTCHSASERSSSCAPARAAAANTSGAST
ncbi:hypothetical protein [Streptomyces sp. NPDC005859]|uniref:hypothetical protein n=1 Tax=Streptomyces sp. NPDC005859 TaxID=3157170 RepID=UPI00340F1897